jgi:hypothetical protein
MLFSREREDDERQMNCITDGMGRKKHPGFGGNIFQALVYAV